MAIPHQVVKRSGAVVPFNPDRITNAIYRAAVAVGGRDHETAENLTQKVVQILDQNPNPEAIPTIEEIQDIVEKVLIENGHARVAKAYILYREERNRTRRERAVLASRPSENIPWAKIWHSLDWSVSHNLNTVSGLNERVRRGEFPDIVKESEAAYDEDVENAAEMVTQHADQLKVVIVSGPSSSGKTTTTLKIGQRLERMKLNLVTLNVDNYFFNLEMHPKDEFGDFDFETPQALDIELINQNLIGLIAGEEVRIPFYDFKTGKRFLDHTPMKLKPNDVILIDSLHGLYEPMTKDIPDEMKFKVYLEPLIQMKDNEGNYIRWTDIRLIRRMIRDAAFRAYDPTKTLLHWHYVRTSEMRNIIPNHATANYIVNTGMPFELPIYANRMLSHFATWVEQYKNDPLRLDAYTRAQRVYDLLKQIEPVSDESSIPSTSVIREFIGGSSLKYH